MLDQRIVFAHRGLNTIAPENTMSAFKLAVEHGVQWIETDVDILGDGTVIVCHDTTLDRTTNLTGSYYGLTAADLPKSMQAVGLVVNTQESHCPRCASSSTT